MDIRQALITAAGRNQRALPLQTLIDRDGQEKTVLAIRVEEALDAGVEELVIVVAPGDQERFAQALEPHHSRVRFVEQHGARGYGHAIWCAREALGEGAFLHLVGDHLHVSAGAQTCARHVVETARAEQCALSAVQATRETLLQHFGAVGGRRVAGRDDLYQVETVLEKPTPTEAEQRLLVPGLRSGRYLCFFGLHVLTPGVMTLLDELVCTTDETVTLSAALARLAGQEKYLALEVRAQRYDVGVKYGLLTAQLALALSGAEREIVLERLLELLAQREAQPI
jgi:UTP--glucose-1-phosphate uridylyltransferase